MASLIVNGHENRGMPYPGDAIFEASKLRSVRRQPLPCPGDGFFRAENLRIEPRAGAGSASRIGLGARLLIGLSWKQAQKAKPRTGKERRPVRGFAQSCCYGNASAPPREEQRGAELLVRFIQKR